MESIISLELGAILYGTRFPNKNFWDLEPSVRNSYEMEARQLIGSLESKGWRIVK